MTERRTNHGDTQGDWQKQDVEDAAKVKSGEDRLDKVAAAGKDEVTNTIFEHHLGKAPIFAPSPELSHSKQRDAEVKDNGYYM